MQALARLLGLLFATSSPADAESSVDFHWVAPAECPSDEEVVARVEVTPSSTPVRASGEVVVTQDGWSLSLRVEGHGGTDVRTFEGESCEALADAAALLMQVAAGPTLDEPSVEESPEPEVVPVPEPPPPAATDTPAPTVDAAPSSSRLPLRVYTRGVGFVQLGALLPAFVSGGGELAAGVSIPWVRLEARGSYVAPRRRRDGDHPGVGIDVDGWSVGGSACGVWERRRLLVPLCVGAQGGRSRARSFGLEQDGVGRGRWVQVVADTALGVRVHPRIALLAGGQAIVTLERPKFRVQGFPPLFQTGWAGGRVFAGVEVLLRSPK